jgi:carboxylesterase type B
VKGSANLYRTAISESGLGSPGTYSSYYNMSDALDYSNSVVQRLNCKNDDKQKVLLCIRNSSIQDLFQAYGSRYTRPIIDDYFFPLYPPLSIQNGTYNNISLIMGNNDYEQSICSQHPFMTFNEAVKLLTQSVDPKWLPSIIDYYHLTTCSLNLSANNSRCCNLVRLILMDKIFDCDIRRLFNAFYFKYGSQYENNKLFSYHLNCYPKCPLVLDEGICRHSSELPYVFGTVSDADSQKPVPCTWDKQSRQFSNEVISHWINIATTGRPLNSWPNYDPSTPEYFHMTPDQGFLPITWNRNCSIFDEIEKEGVVETFGNYGFLIKGTSV